MAELKAPLTELQSIVLSSYSEGKTLAEIAEQMLLSEITISIILRSSVKALDAKNVAGAAIIYDRLQTKH